MDYECVHHFRCERYNIFHPKHYTFLRREFLKHFGFMPDKEPYYNSIEMDCCLCSCDIEKTLTDKNIPFKRDCGDLYVGMLDEIVWD